STKLIDFVFNSKHQDFVRNPPSPMSTTVTQSITNSRTFSKHPCTEEPVSYCAPWDLKSQEEKLKLLTNNHQQQKQSSPSSPAHTNLITQKLSNDTSSTFRQQNIAESKQQQLQQSISLSANALLHPEISNSSSSINNSNKFHRTRSARTSKKSLQIQSQPPVPPLPPGGLKTTCHCGVGNEIDPSLKKIAFCLNAHALRCTDTSRSFIFSSSTDKPQQIQTQPLTVKVDTSLVIENKQQQSPLQSKSNTSTLSTTSSISPMPNNSSSSNDSFSNKTQTATIPEPLSFEAALLKFKRLSSTRSTVSSSSSLKHDQQYRTNNNDISYERPWDAMQTSLIGSLTSPTTTNGALLKNTIHTENDLKFKRETSSPPMQIMSGVRTSCTNGKCCNTNNVHQAATIVETNKTSFRGRCSSPSLITKTVENNTTDNDLPIDRYFWYHYSLSRRKAETLLYNRPCGSFLVRQSESGNKDDYSLSIRTASGCVHMRICSNNGVYILGQCSHPFSTVPRMIEYYSQCEVPIKGVQHVKLAGPVFRSPEDDLL
ncbi:unnamed protein product, partial [Didymodactylos carnosus]